MAKEFVAARGDEFRIVCPECNSTWNTVALPSDCPTCAAIVSVRIVRKPAKK